MLLNILILICFASEIQLPVIYLNNSHNSHYVYILIIIGKLHKGQCSWDTEECRGGWNLRTGKGRSQEGSQHEGKNVDSVLCAKGNKCGVSSIIAISVCQFL